MESPLFVDTKIWFLKHYGQSDEKGRFTTSDLTAAGVRYGESGLPWHEFDPTSIGRHWAVPHSAFNQALAQGQNPDKLSVQERLDILNENGYIVMSNRGIPRYKRYLSEDAGVPAQELFEGIPPVNPQAAERLGYPTQKPESLLERVIEASSNDGDTVMDPFCGCGTTIAVAEHLHRRWIGIDVTHLAITLMERRLKDAFGDQLGPYQVVGDPKDVGGSRALAEANRH